MIAEDNSGKKVYGGRDDKAAVTNNTVTITGTIANAYGGAGSDMMLVIIILLLMAGQ